MMFDAGSLSKTLRYLEPRAEAPFVAGRQQLASLLSGWRRTPHERAAASRAAAASRRRLRAHSTLDDSLAARRAAAEWIIDLLADHDSPQVMHMHIPPEWIMHATHVYMHATQCI